MSDSIVGHAIHFIDQINVNQLLLGTNKGNYIFIISERRFVKINLPQKVYSSITTLFRIRNKLYIGSESGIFEYDENKQTGIQKSNKATICKQLSPNGQLFLGTKANGIWEVNLKSDTLLLVRSFPKLKDEKLISIEYQEDGTPVFLTDKGLWISGKEEIRMEESGFFTSLSISQNDEIVIGTNNEFIKQVQFANGIYSLKNYIIGENEIFNDYYDSQINVLFSDYSGAIWMGTNRAGLNRIDRKKLTYKKYGNCDQKQNCVAGYINGLTQGDDGQIWIGTSGKGLYLLNQEKVELEPIPILQGNMNDLFIEAILQFKNKLYIGTRHMGIITANYPYVSSKKVEASGQLFSAEAGLNKNDYIYALKQFNGKLYICSNKGSFVCSGEADDLVRLDSMSCMDIEVDSLNNMWVLSLNMELYYNLNKYELGTEVSDFYIEDSKEIWVTTSKGLALIQIDGTKPVFFNPPDKVIEFTSIEKDKDGQFWLGSRMGMYRFDSQNKLFASYQIPGGSKANSFNHGKLIYSQLGELYFGSNDGVVSILPNSNSYLSESLYKVEQGTKGTESVFKVYSYSFNHHDENGVAYRFSHPDSTWNYISGNQSTLDFSHFRKGSYQLDITTINSDGIVSPEYASFQFKMKRSYNGSLILWLVFAFISGVIILLYWRSKNAVTSFIVEDEEPFVIETPVDIIYNGWMRSDFMQKAIVLIENNLSNSSYGVNELYAGIQMSKSNFYRKLKTNTELSPNELIRFVRLKKSTQLLIEAKLSVNEIAYDMGFNSPSYFTRCFKQQFGISPSEYKSYYESLCCIPEPVQ
ncbi:hypothetical protein ALGA_0404 [Labilibaculum antarcticum]|uniref:HTH araC/xylS-type domain-containing protein n=2 Tax=Labilibaculum antarcticum TaxID=1717717 RepID=A0A1Y1CEL5_9BACT|nr:hypothetical protein ALGA_0404 [Labilibaculum antarcticum]